MCKIMAITKKAAAVINRKQKDTILTLTADLFGDTERDGFGWAAWTSAGLYGERYIDPDNFSGLDTLSGRVSKHRPSLFRAIEAGEIGSVGELGSLIGPIIIHGRTSTNDVKLVNTHPFIKNGWALVHNGVVSYDGPDRPLRSTCDSEHIINTYAYGRGHQEWKDTLSGYAATATITPKGGLIIAKDDAARLYFAKVGDGYIFATCGHHITEVCDAAGVGHGAVKALKDNCALTFGPDGAAKKAEEIKLSSRWRSALASAARLALAQQDLFGEGAE